jgi:osmoprotectant transport system substrate-binding protein
VGRCPRALVAALAIAVGVLTGCSGHDRATAPPTPSAVDDDAITVASFDFAESRVLAELYAQALEARGLQVHRAIGIGPRELVGPALSLGLVELVPEYAGTALAFLSLGQVDATADAAATHQALVQAAASHDLAALTAAPAQDANAFVVTRDTAARHHLQRVSDLAAVAPQLTFGGPPECPTRPLCLEGLQSRYGVHFGNVLALDAGGPTTRQALEQGAVDVGLLFTTDPGLQGGDLVALEDDRGLQPAENVTPLVRTEVMDRWGADVTATLDALSARLTTEALRALDAAAADASPAAAARDWLRQEGLVDP